MSGKDGTIRDYNAAVAALRQLTNFVRESNLIEGILREPTALEITVHEEFLALSRITIDNLVHFVGAIQPGARLRDKRGLDVRVGAHTPIPGSPYVREQLQDLLDRVNMRTTVQTPYAGPPTPYAVHHQYLHLHPFTDGNGRSGRALWLWMCGGDAPLGFLHQWYYSSLAEAR